MTQYINFYQQEFRRKNDFHKWAIRGGIGITLALLIAINLLQQFNIRQLGNELTQKQDLLNSRKLVHQTLETQLKPKQQNPVYLAQVETLRQANQSRLRALNLLSHRESDNMIGFSFLLDGLGRQRDTIEGIWLKKIRFDDGGYSLRLDGYSHSAELLPRLVQTLAKEEILRGHEFRHVKISRSAEHQQIMDFELDTKLREQPNEAHAMPAEMALFLEKLKQLTTVEKAQN